MKDNTLSSSICYKYFEKYSNKYFM